MEPSCLLRTTHCIPQAKFHQKPYYKSFIDQVCSVKMAGYWPRCFFVSLCSSRSINMQKTNLANIQPSSPHTWSVTHTSFTVGSTSFPGFSLYLEIERGPWEKGWSTGAALLVLIGQNFWSHCYLVNSNSVWWIVSVVLTNQKREIFWMDNNSCYMFSRYVCYVIPRNQWGIQNFS